MTADNIRNIILLYESEVIFERFRKVFGQRYQIFWGKDLNTTMDILAQCDVGVMVCDIHFQNQDIYPVVLVLKHQHPDLVTMIVSQSQDSEAVAALEAQEEIFAALVRPITQKQLNQTLDAAFDYYLKHRKAEAEQIRAAQKEADAAAAAANASFAGMTLIEALNAKAEMSEMENAQAPSSEQPTPVVDTLDLPLELPQDILDLEAMNAQMIDMSSDTLKPAAEAAQADHSVDYIFFEDMEFDD